MGSQHRSNNFKKMISRPGILGERKTTIVRISEAKTVKIGAIIRRIMLKTFQSEKNLSLKRIIKNRIISVNSSPPPQ